MAESYLGELKTEVGSSWATGRKFQLHLYYQIDKVNDTPRLTLTLKYYCWDLYLGSFDFDITGSPPIAGSYNTLAISDSNGSTKHYGTLWSGTFNLSQNSSYTFSLYCDNMRSLNYSGSVYEGFQGENYTIKTPTYTKTLSTPSSPSVSATSVRRNNSVTISWSGVSGASSYYLQYKKNSGSWINYGTVSSTSTSLYLRNLSGYSVGSTFYFRVKAVGDGGVRYYDSSYSSSSSGVTAADTPATISSLSVNKTYFSSGSDYPTLTYSGSDVDGDTVSFDILRNNSSIATKRTSTTYYDSNISPGATYTYTVRINNNITSSRTVTIYKNSKPKVSFGKINQDDTLGIVTIPITVERGYAAKIRGISGTLTVKLFSGDTSGSLTEKKTYSYQISNTSFNSSGQYTYNLEVDYNNSINPYLPYIKEGEYFQFDCYFNDSIENSDTESSIKNQRPAIPNYQATFENIPLTAEGVEVSSYTVEYDTDNNPIYFNFQETGENGELSGRKRVYSVLSKVAKIQMSYTLEAGDSISEILILKSSSTSPSSSDFPIVVKKAELVNGAFSDIELNVSTSGNKLSGYFWDRGVSNSAQTQYYVRYRVILTNSKGITSTVPSDTIQFITNTAPYFSNTVASPNDLIKLNITPNTTSLLSADLDLGFSLPFSSYASNGSEPDESVIIKQTVGGVEEGINKNTCDKYKIELRFPENIIPNEEGSTFSNVYQIKEIFLHNQDLTDSNNFFITLKFIDGLTTGDYIGFGELKPSAKIKTYSDVELRVYAYDTFNEQSINYISKTLTIDFTDKPYFDSETFSIYDITNTDSDVIPLAERDMPRLMNVGEEIKFYFPPATSQRNDEAGLGRGISEYQILYSTDNQNFNLLKRLTVGSDKTLYDLPLDPVETFPDGKLAYTYSHTIRNYNRNANIDFKIIAIDVGQNGENKLISKEIYSDFIKEDSQKRFSDIMVCRKVSPSVRINELSFIGSEPQDSNQIELSYSIVDIGGSYITSPSDYFKQESFIEEGEEIQKFVYKNFERNLTDSKKGQFMIVQVYFSEDQNVFTKEQEILSKIGESYFDTELSFPIDYTNNSIAKNSNKTYYVKLKILVGTNTKANSNIEDDNTVIGESPIYILRSLRPTMGIRNRKVGINSKEFKYTFQVSAGDSSENSLVQFDSGLDSEDKIVQFNLNNGHMIRGIIDCGRLV